MNPEIIPSSTAVELPDYQPEKLSEFDKATIDNQNKTYINPLEIELEARSKFKREERKSLLTTQLRFLIKDNEFYVGEGSKVVTSMADAKIFNSEDAAECFIERKKDSPEFKKFLSPTVQAVRVNIYNLDTYEEI